MSGPTELIRQNCPIATTANDGLMSAAQAAAVASGVSLSVANTWTAAQVVAAAALTDAATIATNALLANTFTVTLGGSRTLANPTNLVAGGTYIWIVTQGGAGSYTLAFGALFKWPAGVAPTLTTAVGSVDMISAVYDGTALRCVATLDLR